MMRREPPAPLAITVPTAHLSSPRSLKQVEDVESKLPAKVPVVVKTAMSAYQSTIYQWIKASGEG